MMRKMIRELLVNVQQGSVDVDEALEKLKELPFKDLGFAKVDNHRALRRNQPETVFCQGKTLGQIQEIVGCLAETTSNILATRASEEVYKAIKEICPTAEYHALARLVIVNRRPVKKNKGLILVVSAGTADLPIAEEAALTAEVAGNNVERLYDVGVSGLHRLLASHNSLRRANVLIVVAGMEGALASVVGGLVARPVIAVPTSVGYGASFQGLSALLSMLNSCAAGVCVVNIDNGFGAGRLAAMINEDWVEI